MSFAQLTPEHPRPENEDEARTEPASPEVPGDELKRAEARRLELLELERAADEGMTPPATGEEAPDA